ncbi:hypothetical protein D3C76_1040390 [compost metagenome]
MAVQLEGRATATARRHHHVSAKRLARFDAQDRRHRISPHQGIAIGHMSVGHRTQPVTASQTERSVRCTSKAIPERFGLVVDGHVRVVFGIVRNSRSLRGHVLDRSTVCPAHVQGFLPDHGKVTVGGSTTGLYRCRGSRTGILLPGCALGYDRHGTDQTFLWLLDGIGRHQVQTAKFDGGSINDVNVATQL